jgi:hypothetical protein
MNLTILNIGLSRHRLSGFCARADVSARLSRTLQGGSGGGFDPDLYGTLEMHAYKI